MTIAVDFDGTIVEHRYPKIGKPIPFAIDTLLQLQKEKHQLLLWTVREGDLLQEAIDYCAASGLHFFAANSNFPHEDRATAPRKLTADLFIDDRNLGGLPDWGVIYNAIQATVKGEDAFHSIMSAKPIVQPRNEKKNIFTRIGEALDKR